MWKCVIVLPVLLGVHCGIQHDNMTTTDPIIFYDHPGLTISHVFQDTEELLRTDLRNATGWYKTPSNMKDERCLLWNLEIYKEQIRKLNVRKKKKYLRDTILWNLERLQSRCQRANHPDKVQCRTHGKSIRGFLKNLNEFLGFVQRIEVC